MKSNYFNTADNDSFNEYAVEDMEDSEQSSESDETDGHDGPDGEEPDEPEFPEEAPDYDSNSDESEEEGDRVEALCRAIAKVKSKFSMSDNALEELLVVMRVFSNFSANT